MAQVKRAAVAALLAGAIAAPAAQAAPFNASLDHAYGLAAAYWGGGPLGCSTLDREIVPNGSLPNGALGEATETSPGEEVECTLYISRSLARPAGIGTACAVEIHELGHLRGLGHSDDPQSVMYPSLTRLPALCWRALWRWEASR